MRGSMLWVPVLAMTLPLAAQRTITCSSRDGQRHFCPANTSNGVVLLQEHSDGVCQQGSTWHYTRRGISVNGGCSADFQVGGNAGNSNANGGYGNAYSNGQNGNSGNGQNSNYGNGNAGNGQNGSYGNGQNGSYGNGQNGSYGNGQNGNSSNGQNGSYGNGQNGNSGNGSYGNGQNGYSNNNNNRQNGYGNNQNNRYGSRGQSAAAIPAGTQLDVRLEQTVRAADVNQGDLIPATLVHDLQANGHVLAPAGTTVQAKVVSAQGSPLDVRLDSMTVNGQVYRLSSSSIHSARDSQNGQGDNNQSAGQELGSILGSLAGGGQLRSGSVFSFRLTSASRPQPVNQ